MVKVSAIYPNTPNARFDWEYYIDKHVARCVELFGTHPGFKGVSVERGLGGGTPGEAVPFVAICQFTFDSAESLNEALAPHAAALQADVANFTAIEPTLQISEVGMSS